MSTTGARSAIKTSSVSRAATTTDTPIDTDALTNAPDYKACRDVYYNCMDEFCANKDPQLKRCACSTRIHDFDGIKKQLAQAEDQLLDFGQRLLTVTMDKEDVAAITQATEGELAFQQKDTSDSKKILDEIANKLQTTSSSNRQSKDLSSISLTLDVDAAFDSLDSTLGASTAAKEGTALYNAALPVCREMAMEICDDESMLMAENGYMMAIEQDCNTVQKAFETQLTNAQTKVRDSGSLLDMARLDIYKERNSDDILSCKKKMLEMLASSTVCGDDYGKCLDTTGQYIDPSTGSAFLTPNLAELSQLIHRPEGDETWAGRNDKFVIYLNTKKKYLEPAMKNCQDISDRVWNEFIEDALSQIKLAQTSKLEEMRQSCTSLLSQCISDTAKSISDFDARALSTFGVLADKTVKEMCATVKESCTALLDADIGGSDTNTDTGSSDWSTGVDEILADNTYDTIIKTCREVGKNCIIQSCKSISGNFGLCESVDKSVNRKAILSRQACWKDVQECVAAADAKDDSTNLQAVADRLLARFAPSGTTLKEFYGAPISNELAPNWYYHIYGKNMNATNTACQDKCTGTDDTPSPECTACQQTMIYDTCEEICTGNRVTSAQCLQCRLAEEIWGNCQLNANADTNEGDTASVLNANNILRPQSGDNTLLSWFATNTGTADILDNCRTSECPSGRIKDRYGNCSIKDQLSIGEKISCQAADRIIVYQTENKPTLQNCCINGKKDTAENCCTSGKLQSVATAATRFAPGGKTDQPLKNTDNSEYQICSHNNANTNAKAELVLTYTDTTNNTRYLYCLNGTDMTTQSQSSPQHVKCNGQFVLINVKARSNDTPQYFVSKPPYINTVQNVSAQTFFNLAGSGVANYPANSTEFDTAINWQIDIKNPGGG